MRPARLVKLSAIEVEADKPLPTEFRIFRAGPNPSDRGDEPFVFDAGAAASVMAAYQKQGNRLMMDLAHSATEATSIEARSDATDAMCWFDLALRDGELWATGVEWTVEGERRLRQKLQRYVSPTFRVGEGNRIVELYNAALVSMAGLRGATDLAAALRAAPNGAAAQLKAAIVQLMCSPKRKRK